MSTAQIHHMQTHPGECFQDQHLSSEWWKGNDLGQQGNKMISVAFERLLSPVWGVPEGLHRILWAFMSHVKNGQINLRKIALDGVSRLFWGQVLFRKWDKEIKQLKALCLPCTWAGRRENGTGLLFSVSTERAVIVQGPNQHIPPERRKWEICDSEGACQLPQRNP